LREKPTAKQSELKGRLDVDQLRNYRHLARQPCYDGMARYVTNLSCKYVEQQVRFWESTVMQAFQ
jgi:hypothetical protein